MTKSEETLIKNGYVQKNSTTSKPVADEIKKRYQAKGYLAQVKPRTESEQKRFYVYIKKSK